MRGSKKGFLLLLVATLWVLLGCLGASRVFAATYYVSPSGSGDCSQSNPCSFQTALTNAQNSAEDDTIIVTDGTYNIGTMLTYKDDDGNAGSLTIEAAGDAHPVLDGGRKVHILSIETGSDNDDDITITIKGLEFKNGDAEDNDPLDRGLKPELLGGGVLVITQAAKVVVDSCRFVENIAQAAGGGLFILTQHGHAVLKNSSFWKNKVNLCPGGGGGAAIYLVYNGNATVINNTFYNNMGGSCFAGGLPPYGSGCLVEAESADYGAKRYCYMYNNIAYENYNGQDMGVINQGSSDDRGMVLYLYNNDIKHWGQKGIVEVHSGYNINEDPVVENAYWGNLHLQEDSPCIDTGCNTAVQMVNLTEDLDGHSRIYNDTVDIGAYEYSASPEALPPIPSIAVVWPQDGAKLNFDDFAASEGLVVFAWRPVEGASVYEMHLVLDNGNWTVGGDFTLQEGTDQGELILLPEENLAGIYFVLDEASWNALVPYTVTWQVRALGDPSNPHSLMGESSESSFSFNP